jgi:hypothetical protein
VDCHSVLACGEDMPDIDALLCARCWAAAPFGPDQEVGSAQSNDCGCDPCIFIISSCFSVQHGCDAPGGHGVTLDFFTRPMCAQNLRPNTTSEASREHGTATFPLFDGKMRRRRHFQYEKWPHGVDLHRAAQQTRAGNLLGKSCSIVELREELRLVLRRGNALDASFFCWISGDRYQQHCQHRKRKCPSFGPMRVA